MKIFCLDIEATKAAEILGFNRKTVNRYYKIFRTEIARYRDEQKRKMVGTIELDESYFGATRRRRVSGPRKRGRGTSKQPVFGIFKRKGAVYTEIVSDVSKKTLQAIIRGKLLYRQKWLLTAGRDMMD